MCVWLRGVWPRPGVLACIAVTAAVAMACLAGTTPEADAQTCKPRRPKPPVVLKSMGTCEFDPQTLNYAGNPVQQAMCLMRSADRSRNLGPPLAELPAALATRVGQDVGLPDRSALAAVLIEVGLVWDFAPFLWAPVSRAVNNDPAAPQARYFVVHDTSAPNFGFAPFPPDIDRHRGINNLARYDCIDGFGPAHVVIGRNGGVLLTHELGIPWLATKFERAEFFEGALLGLFIHVELVQPRRSAPGRGWRNDAVAPTPGFSAIQYDGLALIYTIASTRAGRWLIPAFHIAIDTATRGGHDDPQNFDIEAFAASIDRLMQRLERHRVQADADPEGAALAAQADDGRAAVAD